MAKIYRSHIVPLSQNHCGGKISQYPSKRWKNILCHRAESIDGYKFYSAKNINTTALNGSFVSVIFDSGRIGFVDFLRGFRARSFDIVPLSVQPTTTLRTKVSDFIAAQHSDERLQKLFVSLFFETRLSDELQQKINEFGLSAVMSLSGLNLTLLVALIFLVLTPPYRYFQDRYFPYRNRKFDLLVISLALMIFYAYLADFSKPFVRALVMAMVAFVLALRGYKVVGIRTLILSVMIIIVLSPRSLFSIGLWLSVAGVYYIFLFLRHTKELKIWQSYILLGIFVFLAMNIIARYLFPMFTLAQLTSPVTSILFDYFYPIEVVLHIFSLGWIFDSALVSGLELSSERVELPSPDWFFYAFAVLSVLAYWRRELFLFCALVACTFTVVSIVVIL